MPVNKLVYLFAYNKWRDIWIQVYQMVILNNQKKKSLQNGENLVVSMNYKTLDS